MPQSNRDQLTVNSPGKPRKARTLASRTINVAVPDGVYWHIRKCATQSRLSMKEFMAKFCREARPYPPEVVKARVSDKK